MKKLLIFLALIMPLNTYAGSFVKYGLSVLGDTPHSPAKIVALGYAEEWFGPLSHQWEVGVFADSSSIDRKNSGFGFYSVGIEVNPSPVVVRSLLGAGLITTPDSVLGGNFQFTQDFLIGLRDQRRNLIGLSCKHISNGGLTFPNKGRNFLALQVEIPW